jgi:hypothetical protein
MKIFNHTAKERGLWRGWLKDGQSVEVSYDRRDWEFGAVVTIHGNDGDRGHRLLNLSFWRLSVWLPLGVTAYPWEPLDGPRWGVKASREFGLCFHWGQRRKSFDWPWDWHTLAYETLMSDQATWRDLDWQERKTLAYTERHPYAYTLRSGKVQERTATVTKRRHVLTWRAFRHLGWPRWIKESIDVEFDGEVGERTGSWKGGCIGCGYDMKPGETMEQTLRRMERERVFR